MSPFTDKTKASRSRSRGFTLVEILVVICLIGLLAAIGIGINTHINEAAVDSANRRNAQHAVAVYGSATAAGAVFSSSSGDVEGVIRELNEGKNGVGQLNTSLFRLPTMPIRDMEGMIALLSYDPNGGGLMVRTDL